MKNDELVSPTTVAERLNVRPETVRRWIREGRLRAFRCGPKVIRLSWKRTLEALEQEPRQEGEGR
jgi:excisionase family DNA binding protein